MDPLVFASRRAGWVVTRMRAVLFMMNNCLSTGLQAPRMFILWNHSAFSHWWIHDRKDVIVTSRYFRDSEETGSCGFCNFLGDQNGEECMEFLLNCSVYLQKNTWREGLVVCKAWHTSHDALFDIVVTMDGIQDQWESDERELRLAMIVRGEYRRLMGKAERMKRNEVYRKNAT